MLHPGQNEHDGSRGLVIFHETTSIAIKSYFPDKNEASQFLNLMHKIVLVCNSKSKTHGSNSLRYSANIHDNKVAFVRAVLNGLRRGSKCRNFRLSVPTGKAIVVTQRSQVSLIENLLSEGYH